MKFQSLILPALKIALLAVAIVTAYLVFDGFKTIYLKHGLLGVVMTLLSLSFSLLSDYFTEAK